MTNQKFQDNRSAVSTKDKPVYLEKVLWLFATTENMYHKLLCYHKIIAALFLGITWWLKIKGYKGKDQDQDQEITTVSICKKWG